MIENIKMNKIDSIVEAINDDSEKICLEKDQIADRIIMGLLPSPKDYILSALHGPGGHHDAVCIKLVE